MLGDHDDERVFTVRIWRERTSGAADEREWRGRLYDAQSRTFHHFVGLPMLLDLIRTLLAADPPAAASRSPGRAGT